MMVLSTWLPKHYKIIFQHLFIEFLQNSERLGEKNYTLWGVVQPCLSDLSINVHFNGMVVLRPAPKRRCKGAQLGTPKSDNVPHSYSALSDDNYAPFQ